MSKIQLTELKTTNTELNILDKHEASMIIGGKTEVEINTKRTPRNTWESTVFVNTQINIANFINISLGDGNFTNVANQTNLAGVSFS